jgi:hypothetical protein
MSTNIPDDYSLLISNKKSSNNIAGTQDDAVSTNLNPTKNTVFDASIPEQQRNNWFLYLALLAASFVAVHRFLPASFRGLDLLFAGDHFIDDSVSAKKVFYCQH